MTTSPAATDPGAVASPAATDPGAVASPAPAPGDAAPPPNAPRTGPRAALAALRSPLRWPAASAALVAAAAHVPVTREHLTEVPYVGWLFVALSVACVLAALALVVRDGALVWAAAATTCLAAVAGFVVSRGPGLPGMDDDLGDWADRLGLISVATEGLVVVLAVLALRGRGPEVARRWLLLVVVGAFLLTAGTDLLGLVTT